MNNETTLVNKRSSILVAGYTHELPRDQKHERRALEVIESYIKNLASLAAAITTPLTRSSCPSARVLMVFAGCPLCPAYTSPSKSTFTQILPGPLR